jgi:hypothetical protein
MFGLWSPPSSRAPASRQSLGGLAHCESQSRKKRLRRALRSRRRATARYEHAHRGALGTVHVGQGIWVGTSLKQCASNRDSSALWSSVARCLAGGSRKQMRVERARSRSGYVGEHPLARKKGRGGQPVPRCSTRARAVFSLSLDNRSPVPHGTSVRSQGRGGPTCPGAWRTVYRALNKVSRARSRAAIMLLRWGLCGWMSVSVGYRVFGIPRGSDTTR